jgi:hypothetical protein
MSNRGYMLVELVIGAAITCAIATLLFRLAMAAQAAVAVQGNTADQQQRLRVAAERLRHDLAIAGAGPSRGEGRGPLIRVFPPVLPARLGLLRPDPELTVATDRITIVYIPETRAQTSLLSGMAAASSPLAIDGNAPGCQAGTACDFVAGDRAVVYDPSTAGGAHDFLTIASVDAVRGLLVPSAPLSRAYDGGARVAVVTIRSYYVDLSARRLMVYDGDRSDVPLVDRVAEMEIGYLADPRPDAVPTIPLADLGGTLPKLLSAGQLTDGPFYGAAPNRFDADLLRVRRIRVRLRVQSESPASRFRDLETTIEVTPANMAGR